MKSKVLLKEQLKNKIKRLLIKLINLWLPFVRREYGQELKSEFLKRFYSETKIIDPLSTMTEIRKAIEENKAGAFMRFGDGDVFLSGNESEMKQAASLELAKDIKAAFSLNGPYIFKSLSIHSEKYGFEKEMYKGNHSLSNTAADDLLFWVSPYFLNCKIYSPVALHYAATYYPSIANEFLKLLKKKALLFIGNEKFDRQLITKLFGNVPHIKTPSENSYSEIGRVQNEASQFLCLTQKYGVIIVAMGCSGRSLMHNLFSEYPHIFLFDFGSLLDGIAGNQTRTWLKKEAINYEELLEGL